MGDEELFQPQTLERIPSKIEGLDDLLHGGFYQGGLYLIAGTPGTGKSLLANQIAFNHGANGGRIVYLTLLSETHTRLLGYLSGFQFFQPDLIGRSIWYISGYQTYLEQGYEGLVQLVRGLMRNYNASLLVVDGFLVSTPGMTYDPSIDIFLRDIQAYMELTRGIALVLVPVNKETWDSPAFIYADGALELTRSIIGRQPDRRVTIRKLRGTAHEHGSYPFDISGAGIRVDSHAE